MAPTSNARLMKSPKSLVVKRSGKRWSGKVAMLQAKLQKLEYTVAFLRSLKTSPLQTEFEGDMEFILDFPCQEKIQAHRFILASKSSVFRKMFEHDMEVKRTGKVLISDTCGPVLRAFINYMYTAQIDFGHNVTASLIYKLAHKYDVPELLEVCECELIQTVNKVNFREVLELAHHFRSESLYMAAVAHSAVQDAQAFFGN